MDRIREKSSKAAGRFAAKKTYPVHPSILLFSLFFNSGAHCCRKGLLPYGRQYLGCSKP